MVPRAGHVLVSVQVLSLGVHAGIVGAVVVDAGIVGAVVVHASVRTD